VKLPHHPLLYLACLARGGHRPYTHRHAGEPDVTYCLACRISLREIDPEMRDA